MLDVVRDFFLVEVIETDLCGETIVTLWKEEGVPPLDLGYVKTSVEHRRSLLFRKCELTRLDNDSLLSGRV